MSLSEFYRNYNCLTLQVPVVMQNLALYCESLTQPQPIRSQLLYLPSIHHSLAFVLAFPGFQTQHIIALQMLFCAPKQNRAPPMNNSQLEGECGGCGGAGWHGCERVRETGIERVGERERD